MVSVWSGTSGELDEVPLPDIRRFDKEFLDFLGRDQADMHGTRSVTPVTCPTRPSTGSRSAIAEFKQQFRTSEGTLLGHEAEVEAMDQADVDNTKITKKVRKG